MDFRDWIDAFGDILGTMRDSVSIANVTAIGTLLALLGWLVRVVRKQERKVARLEDKLSEASQALATVTAEKSAAEEKLRTFLDTVGLERASIWTRDGIVQPPRYAQRMAASIPIVMVGNLKGGVGKTTISANLAAYFESRGERVLLVDLDFQGSLTAAAGSGSTIDYEAPNARKLLSSIPFGTHRVNGSTTDSRLVDCYYPFANFEMRLMLQWLAGDVADDIRYRLAGVLLSDEVQNRYDRVIIDTAPRMTTGLVNALCAATHLVIPTMLDRLSTEAVESFLFTLEELRPVLLPGLRDFRVAISMKTNQGQLTKAEQPEIEFLRSKLVARGHLEQKLLDMVPIPRSSEFNVHAGTAIAYYHSPKVRALVDPFGAAVYALAPRINRRVHA